MKKKLGWILSLTLCFAMIIAATLVTASADDNVSYIDASGETQICDSATEVTETNTAWGASDSQEHWYVVNSNVTINTRVTVNGNVHLILADGYTLTASQGINVTDTNSLTIYGQAEGTGALTATGAGWQAGIGGDRQQSGGTITINGGTVNATGGSAAAGIGGGYAGVGNTITINGGIVKATGDSTDFGGGAGIGGGGQSSNAEKIVITGGVIIAEGGSNGAAGIGGGGHDGELKSISITGGWIQATGHGKKGNDSDGGANAIGGGASKKPADDAAFQNTVIIDGYTKSGTVYGSASLEENAEIPADYTLTVPSGATLTIAKGVTLTNNGTINVSGTLTNNGTIVDNGTISGSISGDVRYPSGVTVSLTQDGHSVTSVSYGSTITITATMTKQTATNALTAVEETVDFWLGDVDTGTKLGTAKVESGSDGTYTATLTVTLNDATKWIPSNSPYTITANFGGVAGGSGTGLISSTGTATLTVTKASQTAPAAPAMSIRTTTSVTLDTISGGQGTVQYGYNTDGDTSDYHWQNTPGFSGLSAGTDYTFYARYAGNDYYNESPVSAGLTVTTLPEITTTDLNAGYVGVPYNATLQATVDSGKTVTWALATGSSLPNGLTLNNDTISGTPKAAGTYSFTVQAAIKNGVADSEDVINTKALSITINAGTSVVSITSGSGTYTYGETITISGEITASNQAPNNGINSITEPEQNQVGLYSGDTQLATANVTNGSFTITYDTAKQGISIGSHTLTVKYGGSSDLNSGSTTVSITLNPKSVTATVTNTITKVYDGDKDAAVELAVASSDLVNSNDAIAVTGTGKYSSADAGESIDVTVRNIQVTGDDSAWYTVSAPTDVTGNITKATQEAPNAPTVIERTSSSVTLAALGTTGQGALEYGYTTGTEREPGNWQTGTTFTGLTSGTTYTFTPATPGMITTRHLRLAKA